MANRNGLEWFRPMWRRVAVTATCVIWTGWEWLINNDQTWGMVSLAMCAWAVWTFFITFDKNVGPPGGDSERNDTAPPPSQS